MYLSLSTSLLIRCNYHMHIKNPSSWDNRTTNCRVVSAGCREQMKPCVLGFWDLFQALIN